MQYVGREAPGSAVGDLEEQRCKFQSKKLAVSRSKKSRLFRFGPKEKTNVLAPSSQAGGIPSFLAFLFYSALQLTEWNPPELEKTICFTQSTYLKVNLI